MEEKKAIGIDLGGTKIEMARINARGENEESIRVKTAVESGADGVIRQMLEGIETLKDEKTIGVGIGVAGQIDNAGRVIHFAPNLNWHQVPLAEAIEKEAKLPVAITNDVRAAAMAEWVHGEGKGVTHFLALYIGTGIGGGIVTGSKMLTGTSNTAGEVGHLTVSMDGPQCTCGNRGCMEAYAGGWAIARRGRELFQDETLTSKEIIAAYRRGNPIALSVIEEAKEALSAGIASLVNILNPKKVILGGGIVNGLPEIREWLEEAIEQRALSAAAEEVEVVIAKLQNEAGVIGAALFGLELKA